MTNRPPGTSPELMDSIKVYSDLPFTVCMPYELILHVSSKSSPATRETAD